MKIKGRFYTGEYRWFGLELRYFPDHSHAIDPVTGKSYFDIEYEE